MIRKRKFLTLILLCLFSALLMLTLSACTAFDGPQGPKGDQGAQGVQGASGVNGTVWLVGADVPSQDKGVDGDFYLNTASFDLYLKSGGIWSLIGNIRGNDAAQSFAVITFDTLEEGNLCDPIIVEKGTTTELPTPERFGYQFKGWYYNAGGSSQKITEETVIENSMALEAKWTSQLSLSIMEESAYVNEYWMAELYYPLMNEMSSTPPLNLRSIEFEGKSYDEYDALDAGILLDEFYIDIDYNYNQELDEPIYSGYYYIEGIFGKAGDYVLKFENLLGSTLEIEVTVEPPVFQGELSVDFIEFTQDTDNVYYAGDTVTYLNGSAPTIDMVVTYRAPYGSTFSATLNGEALTFNGTYDQGPTTYAANFLGELDEALDTHEFTFTVESEWYGTKTETFTLKIIEAPVENTVLYHSWTEVVTPEEDYNDTFEETFVYYSTDGITPVVTTVLTDGDGETVTTFNPTVTVDGNEVTYSTNLSVSLSNYSVGEYTLTTTLKSDETDQATDVLPAQTAKFYVAPYWVSKTEIPVMILGKAVDLVYELNASVTSIEVAGQRIVQGETADVRTEYSNFELSFEAAEGKTTLTVKATAKKVERYPIKEMLFTTISTEDYSWEAIIYGVQVVSEELIRSYAQMSVGAMKYSLETYFAELLTAEGPVKDLYDFINLDYATADVLDLMKMIEGEEMIELHAKAKTALDVNMEEGETIEPYLTAIRKRVLDECYFSEQTIIILDQGFFGFYLFEDEWYDDYFSLFEIGQSEFIFTNQNGRFIADILYEEMIVMMLEEINYMPRELAEMVKAAEAAHQALIDAEANGETQTQDLILSYMSSMETLILIMMGGGVPILVM